MIAIVIDVSLAPIWPIFWSVAVLYHHIKLLFAVVEISYTIVTHAKNSNYLKLRVLRSVLYLTLYLTSSEYLYDSTIKNSEFNFLILFCIDFICQRLWEECKFWNFSSFETIPHIPCVWLVDIITLDLKYSTKYILKIELNFRSQGLSSYKRGKDVGSLP